MQLNRTACRLPDRAISQNRKRFDITFRCHIVVFAVNYTDVSFVAKLSRTKQNKFKQCKTSQLCPTQLLAWKIHSWNSESRPLPAKRPKTRANSAESRLSKNWQPGRSGISVVSSVRVLLPDHFESFSQGIMARSLLPTCSISVSEF